MQLLLWLLVHLLRHNREPARNPLGVLEATNRVQAQLLGTIKQSKASGISIEKATAEFMRFHDKRRRAEVIAEATYENKRGIIENHLTDYLNYKSITSTTQLKRTTFDDYLSFRSRATRLVQQRECSVIGEWLKFLDDHEYIDVRLLRGRTILPRVEVRMTDRMANPAINPDDWRGIVDYVRNEWRHEPLQGNGVQKKLNKSWFYRNLFWHYILLSKNSGMSPEEVLKLKWKNVDIKDVGRISKSKREEEFEEIRNDGIDILGEEIEIDANDWALEDVIGREERLIAYIYTIRSKRLTDFASFFALPYRISVISFARERISRRSWLCISSFTSCPAMRASKNKSVPFSK